MSVVFNSGAANAPARQTQQRAAAQPVIQSADGIIEAQGCKHGWMTSGPIIWAAKHLTHATDGNLDLSADPDFFFGGNLVVNDVLTGNITVTMPDAADIHSRLNASHYLELPTTQPATVNVTKYAPCFDFYVFNTDAVQTVSLTVGADSGVVAGSGTVAGATGAQFRCIPWLNAGVPSLHIRRVV